MNKFRLSLLVLGFTFGIVGMNADGHKWTLKECIDYAATHNVSIQKNKAQSEEAQINVLQQKGGYLPSLSASSSQSVSYRPFQESATSYVNGNSMTSSSNKTSQNGSYGVNASWTVYNGNQTANNIKAAKLSVEQADLRTEMTLNQIKEQIVQLYVQILYTEEALKVNKEMLEMDEVLYERGKNVLAQGQIAKYELLELQTQVANGKYDIVSTETQISQYKLQLKQLLEIPGNEEFDIADLTVAETEALKQVPTTDEVYEKALGVRPEIKNSEISIQQAELNYKIAKAGWMPSISMSAGFGDSHSSGTNKDWFEQMKRNLDGSVGVSVTVPIFDGRRTKTSVQKADVEKTIAKLDDVDTRKTLYNDIANYRLNAYSYQQRFIAGKEKLNYNEQNYEAIFTKAKIGTMNIVETINARTSLLNAKQDVLQSKYLTIYNMEMLDFYAGNGIDL